MELIAVRVLNGQLLFEKCLPSYRQLSLNELCHNEKLIVLCTLTLNVRPLLLCIKLLIIDLKLKSPFWLLQFLYELEVHEIKSLNISDLNVSFLFNFLKSFEPDISLIVLVMVFDFELIDGVENGFYLIDDEAVFCNHYLGLFFVCIA